MGHTIKEIINESVIEIETKVKPILQVINEFNAILENRHNVAIEQLDNQRLKEIKKLEDMAKSIRQTIYNIRVDADNMSINLIKEQLRRIAETISNCL